MDYPCVFMYFVILDKKLSSGKPRHLKLQCGPPESTGVHSCQALQSITDIKYFKLNSHLEDFQTTQVAQFKPKTLMNPSYEPNSIFTQLQMP